MFKNCKMRLMIIAKMKAGYSVGTRAEEASSKYFLGLLLMLCLLYNDLLYVYVI